MSLMYADTPMKGRTGALDENSSPKESDVDVASVEEPKNDSSEATASEAASASTTTTNDWMSEEEKKEAYERSSTRTKTQVKLDPLQVCLFPTYLSLPEKVLQDDLRDNLHDLVSQKLQSDYGDQFVYFAFTDAKIDWYSGEESQPVCGSSQQQLTAEDYLSVSALKQRDAEGTPCTCALYSGAIVMLKSDGSAIDQATPEVLEPKITSVLTSDLVGSLRSQPSSSSANSSPLDTTQLSAEEEPFYTELKGASVSWSAAQRQQGGKLVYVSNPPESDQQLAPEAPSPEGIGPDSVAVVDESVEDSTRIDVVDFTASALESGEHEASSQNRLFANAFGTTKGKIITSVVGGVLLLILIVLFACLCRKKKRRKEAQASFATSGKANPNDTSTVISERDLVDEEIARGGGMMSGSSRRKKKGRLSSQMPSVDDEEDARHAGDDASEAAQYTAAGACGGQQQHTRNNSSSLLDCISVGSEWTLTTGVTDGLSSALGFGSSNKTAAEAMAAKETFDRDRQITLQKDMLQSEWSGAVVPPSGLNLSRATNRSPKHGHGLSAPRSSGGGNALQFEEAGGQGEEIFLMEPATR